MTRSRILQAALTRFARADYAETSLRDIAADVGIKAPSIYAHFANKEELYTEVYVLSLAEHRSFFTALIAESTSLDPLERLHRILTGVSDFYRDRPDLLALHLRTALGRTMAQPSGLIDAFQVWDAELSAAVRETYLDGVHRGQFTSLPPEAFTSHFLCLMDGLFLQMSHYSPELYAEHLSHTWSTLALFITPPASTENQTS